MRTTSVETNRSDNINPSSTTTALFFSGVCLYSYIVLCCLHWLLDTVCERGLTQVSSQQGWQPHIYTQHWSHHAEGWDPERQQSCCSSPAPHLCTRTVWSLQLLPQSRGGHSCRYSLCPLKELELSLRMVGQEQHVCVFIYEIFMFLESGLYWQQVQGGNWDFQPAVKQKLL